MTVVSAAFPFGVSPSRGEAAMAPKSKVRGPADHEEELADLQRRFDALGELPLPTLAPHGPHTRHTA